MAELTSQSFEPNFSNEIDIDSIISAPLVAASKANVVMATGQQRFLLDFCFDKNVDGSYMPKLIKMVMVKGVIVPDEYEKESEGLKEPGFTIKEERLSFSIPLLCIIPFSSLAIETVTIDFNIELTSAISSESKTAENEIIDKKAHLKGRISVDRESDRSFKQNYKSNSSSSLKVNLHAGKLPLANGLLLLLDLYTKAIQPLPQVPANAEES
jgi:hypothetical protein